MKRGGLGGTILLAAVAVALLLLDRKPEAPRAPAVTAAPAERPEEPLPPEPPPVAVEEAPERPLGGGTLSLVIRAADGSVPEATVTVEPFYDGARTQLDAKERAIFEGLAPEWHRIRIVAPGYAPVFLPVRLHPGGPVEASAVLTAGATLVGTVRTPDGAPVANAAVRAAAWGAARSATTDAAGAYRIEHLPIGRVEMEAEGALGAARAYLNLEDGKEARWEAVLRPLSVLSGCVVEEDGTPVARARVECRWSWRYETVAFLGEETGLDGEFRIEHCGERDHVVSVWRPGVKGPVPAAEVSVRPSDCPVTIPLRRGEGFVRGTVVDRNGAPAAGAAIRVWPAARPDREVRARAAADGSFRVGPLPPGSYLLEIHLDREPTYHLRPAIEIAAGETVDLGIVRFPLGGRIRASVLSMAGGLLPDEEVEVVSLDGSIRFAGEREAGVFTTEELTPGSYLVRAAARGLVEEVSVGPEGLVTAELRLRAGGALTIFVTEAGGPYDAIVRIEDARGCLLLDQAYPGTVFLAEGEWRVLATDNRGRRAEATVRMANANQEVALVLE